MPRTYKPNGGKQYKKYSDQTIHAALREYETTNMSLAQISKKYDVSKSVLHRHNTRFMKKHGGQTVLSVEEEEYIIKYLNHCSEWGYPLDTYDLRLLVKGYLDRIGLDVKKFKENLPGPDFVRSFLRRNKDKISLRISQNIKRSRANISQSTIEEYFQELEHSLEGVSLCNIINYDETNFSDDPGRRKILTKRGAKYPERIMNHSKGSISVMMAAVADGTLLPCYVVYKAKNLYESWVQQGPKGCRYNCTTSGWFDSRTFEDWVHTIALPYFKENEGKKILIGDNLSSYLSLELIRECKEQNVNFVFLPANSTHITQPLDVAFFRPTKGAWRKILFLWKKSEGRNLPTIPKSVFPSLLKKLLDRIEFKASSNILAGFMKSGISPLNKYKVLERLPGHYISDEQNFDKDAIGQTVVKILSEMRYGIGSNKPSNKRKKIQVKPGQSVCTENEESEISDREYNQEQSSCMSNGSSEADSQENIELLERYTLSTNNDIEIHQENIDIQPKLTEKENVKPRTTITAIQIPEVRKIKFESKTAMAVTNKKVANTILLKTTNRKKDCKPKIHFTNQSEKCSAKTQLIDKGRKTTIIFNKINQCNKNEHVFKKPYEVGEYKINKTTQEQKNEARMETKSTVHKPILDSVNLNNFSDNINDIDIEKQPVVFDDNFYVEEYVEIPSEIGFVSTLIDKQNSNTNKNDIEEKLDTILKKNKKILSKIEITSDNILETNEKDKIDPIHTYTTYNKKYYTEDEDILHDLMDDPDM